MASLAFLLGMIPATEKVESADDKLRADFAAYKEFEKSEDLKHFQELESEVNSADFAQRKKKILKAKYKGSDVFIKQKELKLLEKKYKKEDETPEELTTLKKEVEADEFQARVKYLQMNPKERYETTDECKKEKEYNELKKSEKIIWFFKTKKKYPFKEIEKWEETLNESFNADTLDKKRWMTRFFWGDEILDEPYTHSDDKSFPTDGKNIELKDNKLKIITKKEEVEGKKWNPVHGFLQDSFGFTSGLVSTGKSFRQKYGLFKAKIRMSTADITQSFYLAGDRMIPHIDIAKSEGSKLFANYFWMNSGESKPARSITKTMGSRYSKDYFIFSLEWEPGSLVWKINDKVFKKQSSNIPEEEMYIVLSASLKEWAKEEGLPGSMSVDWVRAYKRAAQE